MWTRESENGGEKGRGKDEDVQRELLEGLGRMAYWMEEGDVAQGYKVGLPRV